jgi:hypothetical protein
MSKAPSTTAVRNVLIASIVITLLHYTDNYMSIDEYPQPGWIHGETIWLAWSLFTLVGIAGYLMYRDGKRVAAGIYLLVYSITGLSSLGHYQSGSMGDFTTRMHIFIWTDGLIGLLVAAFAVWILLSRRAPAPSDEVLQLS